QRHLDPRAAQCIDDRCRILPELIAKGEARGRCIACGEPEFGPVVVVGGNNPAEGATAEAQLRGAEAGAAMLQDAIGRRRVGASAAEGLAERMPACRGETGRQAKPIWGNVRRLEREATGGE